MKYILIIILPLLLGGCFATDSALPLLEKAADTAGKVEDATIGNGAKALSKYCAAPMFVRKAMRSRLNGHPDAMGNKLGAWCVGDPVLPLGS